MRLLGIVLITASVASLAFQNLGGWVGSGAALRTIFLCLAALGAGALVRRRSAVAGFFSIALAPVIAALLSYLGRSVDTGPQEALSFVFGLVMFALPYAVLGGITGAIGGALRRRLVS